MAGLPAPPYPAGGKGSGVPGPHGSRVRAQPGRDIVLFTGSGSGFISPLVGGKFIQEVVAVAAAVEKLHPEVSFVSEIGGEDMKTIFFAPSGLGKQQASLHAIGLQRRNRHLHREDRAQAADIAGAAGADDLLRTAAAQDQLEVRHFRRSRRQHAGQGRRPGRGDHRQPVRGGGPAKPLHADEGQHAGSRSASARRAEPVLQRSAGSVAPSPRRNLGRTPGGPARQGSRTISSGCPRRRSTTRASDA